MLNLSVTLAGTKTKTKKSEWVTRCGKDTNIPPKIPEVLRSHQEIKYFLQCVPAFKQIRI